MTTDPDLAPTGSKFVKRHLASTRIWHWINTGLLVVMLMSGLMIFNAHPRLYWGDYGANYDPAWLEIGARDATGFVRIGNAEIETTGVLGWSVTPNWGAGPRAFPYWATLPSYYDLAQARRWHLSAAWLLVTGTLVFGLLSVFNGHVRRDLLPRLKEMSPRHIWFDCRQHLSFRGARNAMAPRYNTLQKLTYLGVTALLIPTLILTGLSMSPRIEAVFPWLPELFGGRQSARSVHFIAASVLVGFVVVHLAMVLVSGPFRQIRAMVTGWFRLPKGPVE